MRAATHTNGVSGFRSAGIFPYNANAISEAAFASNIILDGPVEQRSSTSVQNNLQHDNDITQISFLTTPSRNTSS
jgi:hypothetical protein